MRKTEPLNSKINLTVNVATEGFYKGFNKTVAITSKLIIVAIVLMAVSLIKALYYDQV